MSDLISRSELMAAIKRQYCTDCNNYNGARCRACPADDMLALVDDAANAVPRWIPVEERLPEDGKNVLIFVSTMSSWWHMEVDWRTGNSWHNNAETNWNKITHWMPLPTPPEV